MAASFVERRLKQLIYISDNGPVFPTFSYTNTPLSGLAFVQLIQQIFNGHLAKRFIHFFSPIKTIPAVLPKTCLFTGDLSTPSIPTFPRETQSYAPPFNWISSSRFDTVFAACPSSLCRDQVLAARSGRMSWQE